MKRFELSREYPVSPAVIRDLWRDQRFLTALGRRFGGVGEPEVRTTADATVVVMQRLLPLEAVPRPFRSLLGSGHLTQTETWPTGAAGPNDEVRGSWKVTGSAVPSTVEGTHLVVAVPGGSRHTVAATVKVSVPLVGGRAETLVADNLRKLVLDEGGFVATWLEQPTPAH